MSLALVSIALASAAARAEEGDRNPQDLGGLPWLPQEGLELVGQSAPEFVDLHWIQGGPHTIAGLSGKPFLVRFWTVGCPFCESTAPALVDFERRYAPRGLVVLGVHHPKSPAGEKIPLVLEVAREYGFTFPLAQEEEWKTLEAYWLRGARDNRRFTSVTILVDRRGVIRFIHDGGEFHEDGGSGHEECARAMRAVETMIEKTLEETDR